MKNRPMKHILLECAQLVAAFLLAIMVSVVVLNSYVLVENMYGEKVGYYISPLRSTDGFVESAIFKEMLCNTVDDITRLAVIKEQLETGGEFDGEKRIDVTEYVNLKSLNSKCKTTAVYSLEDLVRWGKYGVEYQDVRFDSKRSFLTYFGDESLIRMHSILGENYTELDFSKKEEVAPISEPAVMLEITEDDLLSGEAVLSKQQEEANIHAIIQEQLQDEAIIDQIFNYVIDQMRIHTGKTVSVIEENGNHIVTLSMLNNRYTTVEGHNLAAVAGDWIEYSMLESNVHASIEGLTYNYDQYMNRNDVYLAGNSNVEYVIRTNTEEGVKYYTNMPMELASVSNIEQNLYYRNFGAYVIYSAEDMRFETNTDITLEEIFDRVSNYDYALPDNTQIWIGVDTNFDIETDSFSYANRIHENIVPHVWQYIILIAFFSLIWFGLWVYITGTTGRYADTGERYLRTVDKTPTELVLVLAVIAVYGGHQFLLYIQEVVEYNLFFQYSEWAKGISSMKMSSMLLFGAFGAYVSAVVCTFWYSFIRRIRGRNLWKCSFCYYILSFFMNVARKITQNRHATIRTLIPYNMFLILNIVGAFWVGNNMYAGKYDNRISIGILGALLFLDAMVGVWLFRNSSERNDILEGIASIRAGETDSLLDSSVLHGENKALADGVNNIGEGIRKAVETSMRDERMKADLITNVSHDIKTPLTSIINYIGLLKREKITQEPAAGYIKVLDEKAHRLKQLTDDLVEASKISSGNIELVMAPMNLEELVKQAIGEFYEKFEEKSLQVVMNSGESTSAIYADSRRMWRVIENLFNNVCKYALEGTRVYVDIENVDGYVCASVKNISANPLNIKPEELTERFIRGDISRSTEGSGLGLSIAKNLTELQQGELILHFDGDLFKATIKFKEYKAEIEERSS
ncbi:MAG: HAMP domain-containing histidine kinase [Lachnospiraceae bacterium]|nr:HAMP domain-containing histidine kinase [Lachnospiraceae bacterium]